MDASRRRRQRGQAIVLLALFAVVLLGMAGLSVDLGRAYLNRRSLQAGADSAADAGAQLLARNWQQTGSAAGPLTDAQVLAVVTDVAGRAQAGGNRVSAVTASYTDASGTVLGTVGGGSIPAAAVGVRVQPEDQQPTSFMRVLGVGATTQRAAGTVTLRVLQTVTTASPSFAPYAVWWQQCRQHRPIAVGDHVIFRSNAYGSDAACDAGGYTVGSNDFKGYFHDGPATISAGDDFDAKGGNALGQEPLDELSSAFDAGSLLVFPVISSASGNGSNLTFHDTGFVALRMDDDYSSVPPSQDWTGTVVAFLPSLDGMTGCTPGTTGCGATTYTPVLHGVYR